MEELLNEQMMVISRHIDKHKWYKGIAKKEDAIKDFIDKYAWMMREMYCDLCPTSKDCVTYKNYLIQSNGGILKNGK